MRWILKVAFVFLAVFSTLFVLSCSESSPKKVEHIPEKAIQASEQGDISKESFRPDLDILFVIDDSYSMDPHQANLSRNAALFADAIVKAKFLDYHVGVITASLGSFYPTGNGKLFGSPRFIDRTTPNGLWTLSQNIMVGVGGTGTENFFETLKASLSDPLKSTYNQGFLRESSYLAVLFLTDTDDQSQMTAQQMYDFLIQLKGSADRFFIGAAYIPDSEVNNCRGETSEIIKLDNLPQFFKMTQAATFSLCDPDFGQKLAEIGQVIAKRAQTMLLKKIPKKGTIKVLVGDTELINDPHAGWTYNAALNAIEFGSEIDWEQFPDNTFPQVNFEAIDIENPNDAVTSQ